MRAPQGYTLPLHVGLVGSGYAREEAYFLVVNAVDLCVRVILDFLRFELWG